MSQSPETKLPSSANAHPPTFKFCSTSLPMEPLPTNMKNSMDDVRDTLSRLWSIYRCRSIITAVKTVLTFLCHPAVDHLPCLGCVATLSPLPLLTWWWWWCLPSSCVAACFHQLHGSYISLPGRLFFLSLNLQPATDSCFFGCEVKSCLQAKSWSLTAYKKQSRHLNYCLLIYEQLGFMFWVLQPFICSSDLFVNCPSHFLYIKI